MGRSKNKGAASDAPESTEFVLVKNSRGGAIHVGHAVTFTPGSSVHEQSVFEAFTPDVRASLSDMVAEGWLEFAPHDGPEAPAPAPAAPPVLEPVVDLRPTLEAVAASTSAAELDAWFHLPGLSVEVSEAIFAKLSALSPA